MNKILVKIFRGLIVLFSKLPLKFHYAWGDMLSGLMKNILHYRTDVALINLSRSFPEKKYHEIKEIYDETYRHVGEIFAEAIWFGGSDSERVRKSGIAVVMNPEELDKYYRNSPSMTVLSTHCGNWELLGGLLSFPSLSGAAFPVSEKEISVVYKEMSNKVSDRVFAMNRISPLKEVGTECEVESRNILRFALKHKDERRMYIYPADQCPYWDSSRHPIGEFMHQPTDAMTGSVGIACKLHHSVMYMKMRHIERAKYEITFIPICLDASLMKPEEIVRKYYDLLEEELNETPYNWLWTHKRWK